MPDRIIIIVIIIIIRRRRRRTERFVAIAYVFKNKEARSLVVTHEEFNDR
jgi:hypothetical protein